MERSRGASNSKAPEPGRPGTGRRYADQPSFSSSLLDAIYKSMDEPGGAAEAQSKANKKREEDCAHHHNNNHYYYRASLAGSYRASSRVTAPHATTSSSSDCSSYGGFSSSEAESSQQQHRRLRPIRTSVAASGAAVASAAQEKKAATKKKEKPGAAIRAKLRDLRGKPASPGARLAGFLNSIFAGKQHQHQPRAESACSTASSSYSRSCLSKTPSTRGQQPTGKRTVRFLDSDDAASGDRRGGMVQVGVVHLEQMLLRRMEMESDDDDDSSDASSDLFELENLAPAAGGGAAAYRDELPVYETTSTRVVLNRAGIAHGHGRSTARVV